MTLGPRDLQLRPGAPPLGLRIRKTLKGLRETSALAAFSQAPPSPVLLGAPIWASVSVSPDVTWNEARVLPPLNPCVSLILRLGRRAREGGGLPPAPGGGPVTAWHRGAGQKEPVGPSGWAPRRAGRPTALSL